MFASSISRACRVSIHQQTATTLGGEIMMQPDKLGKIAPGFKADVILVAGDPVADIAILQDQMKITAVMKDGAFHRDPGTSQAATR